jgi:hypothetical protein
MAKVTYRPIEQTDPNFIECWGIRFDANVPVEIEPDHCIVAPMPTYTMVNGIRQSIHHDTEVPIIDLAKGNKFFVVEDGGDRNAARRARMAEISNAPRSKPKTTEEDIFEAATEGLARPARGKRKAA